MIAGADRDPDSAADALTPSEFTRLVERLGPFEPSPTVAVGVSGGRDSLALAHLTHDWAQARGGGATALIVDHGLRPASANEAQKTAKRLNTWDMPACILTVDGAPQGNLQAWARAQRYALMQGWCRDNGVLHLLVAHHQEDQAETVLAAIKQGIADPHADPSSLGHRGLAGMAMVRDLAHCRLLRPLLDIRRDRLTATLQVRGIAWIDDPSNADRRFRRVRLRDELARTGKAATLAQAAIPAARQRHAADRETADALAALLSIDTTGGLSLPRDEFLALPQRTALAVLTAVLRWAGQTKASPRPAHLVALYDWIARIDPSGGPNPPPDTGGQRRTLLGTAVTLDGAEIGCRPEGPRTALRPAPSARQPAFARPLLPASFAALPPSGAQSAEICR